jgi:hypothetical protein
MNAPRYLCSELVTLRVSSIGSIVNLEEIWREGAILECEDAVEDGVAVEMQCGDVVFAGRVIQVERHEVGWRVEVEFSQGTPWDQERFQPRHMLDASQFDGK